MTRKRTKILALAVVILIVSLLSQTTLAYYTVIGKATNVVTSGDIQLKIHETTDGKTPFPVNGVTVIPGDTVDKVVTVENTCDHPFWLRVKLVYGTDSKTLNPEEVLLITDLNDTDWIFHEGYYYYRTVVQPGKQTPALFTKVHIAGNKVDQHNATEMLSLTVKAYAVQSENNPAAKPWNASGWPVD